MNSCVCDGASYWTERGMCVFDENGFYDKDDLETTIDIAHDVFFNSKFGNEFDSSDIYDKQFVVIFQDEAIPRDEGYAIGTCTNYGFYYEIVIVSDEEFP